MSAGEFLLGVDNFPYLALFGLVIGALGGFFGVGGGFLMVPMLNVVFGVPYNIAVGSDLGQMCGMSTAATVRHMRFGNIDFKLGFLMIVGTASGVEVGAQLLELLKHVGSMSIFGREIDMMTVVMSLVYAALLIFLGQAMVSESLRTMRRAAGQIQLGAEAPAATAAVRLRTVKLWPMVSLPASGIESVSLWVILGIGFATGLPLRDAGSRRRLHPDAGARLHSRLPDGRGRRDRPLRDHVQLGVRRHDARVQGKRPPRARCSRCSSAPPSEPRSGRPTREGPGAPGSDSGSDAWPSSASSWSSSSSI